MIIKSKANNIDSLNKRISPKKLPVFADRLAADFIHVLDDSSMVITRLDIDLSITLLHISIMPL